MSQERWFGVEVRHLAALAAVAHEGSFRGAADSLGYVQSAVSQQIANLERLVGVRLVERFRGSKEVRLTPDGELLLGHAEEILGRLHAARADLMSHVEGNGMTLKVGVFECVANGLLPSVLRRLGSAAPHLHVETIESPGDAALFDLVEQGAVDIAFGEAPLRPGPFESRVVLRESCALLVPADSPWAERKEPFTVDELAELPLIGFEGRRSADNLEAWFAAQGLRPEFALRARTWATLRAFVGAGLGAAIVPWLAVEPDDAKTTAIDLDALVPGRDVAIYWHRERRHGRALQLFCDVAARAVREVTDRRVARMASILTAAPALAAG